jgi:hypothetical protein
MFCRKAVHSLKRCFHWQDKERMTVFWVKTLYNFVTTQNMILIFTAVKTSNITRQSDIKIMEDTLQSNMKIAGFEVFTTM